MAHGALALAVTLLAAQGTQAAVSEDEAKDLGGKLTAFGAESGANADGSIPAYDGGMKAAEKSGDRYDNPFAGEKPLYSITAKNMAQYDKLLTPGAKEMLKRFPDYRLDVYPTHRTMRYPDWYVENTRKNATTAKLEGKVEGDKIAGAAEDGLPFQGIPFPIPKSGYEVMWNHALRYAPAVTRTHTRNWLVDSGGSRNELPGIDATYLHPWSEETGKLRKQTYDAYFGFNTLLYSPPTQAGTQFLNYYTPDAAAPAPIWIYTPGQRRVRKAPEFAYDIPMSAYSGVLFWDEPWGFEGRMDRFDFKLVGKREMIIPYNDFDLVNKKSEEVLSKQHLNPDAVRWEKHRVWSVEATRKPDARHAYSKRTFEIEEDCWCIVNAESYDNSNALWRVQYLYNFPTSDVGGMNDRAFTVNDLLKGNYVVINVGVGEPGNYVRSYKSQEGLSLRLSPQAVSAGSVR
jgi:hypothetical protein